MQKLEANGIINISENVLRALAQNRISTTSDFLQEDITKLSAVTKLSLPQVLATRNDIFEKYSAPIINGTTLLDRRLRGNKYQCTGLVSLDTILDGGIPKGYITEVCGLADSGKTQLCFQLAINCVKSSDHTVLYIDTKGDFSAVRIQKMLDVTGLTHKEMAMIMYKIRVVRVWSMDELVNLMESLKNKTVIIENLSLIIVDSLPCLMFQFLGDNHKMGLSMLNTFVNYSRYICHKLEICMVCVNIQTRWVDQENISDLEDDVDCSSAVKETYNETRNRCLGKYWQQIPYLVLLLEKSSRSEGEKSNFSITVMKSNNFKMNSRQCTLSISAVGIT